MIEKIGLISAIILPLWNIPLIVRIIKRKSSSDISTAWAVGVLVCLFGMFPSAMIAGDLVFKVFSVGNLLIFSIVVIQVLRYR